MEVTTDSYLLLLTFMQITAFSSVVYIIYKIHNYGAWSKDMKYYMSYFLVALLGVTASGLVDIFRLPNYLNALITVYIGATIILLLAMEERTRTNVFKYSSSIILTLFLLSTLYFDYSDYTLLMVHTFYAMFVSSLLFILAVKKAKRLNNIGYNLMSLAFILIFISALFELSYLLDNNLTMAYTTAKQSVNIYFVLIIIGFLATVLMNELNIANKMALTDTLTNMNNRRGLDYILQTIIPSSNRDNRCFSVVTIDIDFFKEINDTYGHDGGDIVLKEFANIIKTNHRNSDISARFGGEEFVIVLPDTDKETSIVIAEKLRQSVEESVIQLDENHIKVTASFGLSTSCSEINIDTLLKDADKALYISKFAGRNMVVHIDDNCIDDISSFMKKKQNANSN